VTSGHADAIAELVVARLDAAPPRTARRLLRPQLRWVAEQLDERLAREPSTYLEAVCTSLA
jgi:hypothetical protein